MCGGRPKSTFLILTVFILIQRLNYDQSRTVIIRIEIGKIQLIPKICGDIILSQLNERNFSTGPIVSKYFLSYSHSPVPTTTLIFS